MAEGRFQIDGPGGKELASVFEVCMTSLRGDVTKQIYQGSVREIVSRVAKYFPDLIGFSVTELSDVNFVGNLQSDRLHPND